MSAMTILSGHRGLAAAGVNPAAGGLGARRVVAIGNFDGVHRGHQELFRVVREVARAEGAQATVLTFTPHPARVLAPRLELPLVTTPARKRELIAGCGIELLVEEPFDAAFAALSPQAFVDQVLVAGLGALCVCVGYDFTFGKGRAGNTQVLAQLLTRHGLRLEVLPAYSVPDGEGGTLLCSSTRVRQEVRAGRPDRAALILGRAFEVEGVVVRGAGRGRTLGVPTANLRPETELLPGTGVYAAWAELFTPGQRQVAARFPAAVNVGHNPTFTSGAAEVAPQTVEAHLILPAGAAAAEGRVLQDLYDRELRLGLVRRLREEQRFPSVAELMAQIRRDIDETVRLLAAA